MRVQRKLASRGETMRVSATACGFRKLPTAGSPRGIGHFICDMSGLVHLLFFLTLEHTNETPYSEDAHVVIY